MALLGGPEMGSGSFARGLARHTVRFSEGTSETPPQSCVECGGLSAQYG